MTLVYFDCYAGISGDMIVGALLDLGFDLEVLKSQLAALKLDGYTLGSQRVERGAISASKFDVNLDQTPQPKRSLADIRSIIIESTLSELTKQRSIATFERLAVAEAEVHGTTVDKVHFHEVGAVDSIVDIVGAMIGFEHLKVDKFLCSSLRVGSGTVQTDHGALPVPAPATLNLLKGVPIYAGDIKGEFVTPTGAAIISTLCSEFGPLPAVRVEKVGYGAGSRNPKGFSNALRVLIGEDVNVAAASQSAPSSAHDETIFVVETNIDDMNPQAYGFAMERAFEIGALDVFITHAQMKKDRPGVLLTALCRASELDAILELVLQQTTTLGVRYYQASRRVLVRTIETVDTEYGAVRIKVARDGERTLHFQPEYDDCVSLATMAGVPVLEVLSAANARYRQTLNPFDSADKKDGE